MSDLSPRLLETRHEELAIVVGLIARGMRREEVREHLEELALLASTAGATVVQSIVQERSSIDPATFIGSGKAAELGTLVADGGISSVIFDDDLSPVQVRNLEKIVTCKILDRSGLILDIFASRAKSKEAMTQVELAQLQYLLPRLTRQWTHLSKQYGGVGTKGPGEQQIETDRRAVRTRISILKRKLQTISNERLVQRKGREDRTRVALVGYTNAGKSTLLRALSGARVLVMDRLFTTLDTTVRQVTLSPGVKVLLSDTVGFIRKLPPHLIASFRSTLAEATEADLLLHVVDVSHPRFDEHIAVVNDTLAQIGAGGKPTVYVFNKIDRLSDRSAIADLSRSFAPSVFISASRGINLPTLVSTLTSMVGDSAAEQTVVVRQSEYRTIAMLHEMAEIVQTDYEDNTVKVRFRVSPKNRESVKRLLGRTAEPAHRE